MTQIYKSERKMVYKNTLVVVVTVVVVVVVVAIIIILLFSDFFLLSQMLPFPKEGERDGQKGGARVASVTYLK